MLRRLYDWVIRLAAHPQALAVLGVVSFLESSIFPIPPDAMLIPMVLADRTKAFKVALVCTVCSVLGGLLGYAIGYYFFETLGEWVVQAPRGTTLTLRARAERAGAVAARVVLE